MDRRNRRRARRPFAPRPRRGGGDGCVRFPNVFSIEFWPLMIIEPASRPNWSATLLLGFAALIVLGAALIFIFAR